MRALAFLLLLFCAAALVVVLVRQADIAELLVLDSKVVLRELGALRTAATIANRRTGVTAVLLSPNQSLFHEFGDWRDKWPVRCRNDSLWLCHPGGGAYFKHSPDMIVPGTTWIPVSPSRMPSPADISQAEVERSTPMTEGRASGG